MQEKCNKECEYINTYLSTTGAYISFLDTQQYPIKVMPGKLGANSVFNTVDNKYAFNHFIHNLRDFITLATTVALNYGRYTSVPIKIDDLKEIITL